MNKFPVVCISQAVKNLENYRYHPSNTHWAAAVFQCSCREFRRQNNMPVYNISVFNRHNVFVTKSAYEPYFLEHSFIIPLSVCLKKGYL